MTFKCINYFLSFFAYANVCKNEIENINRHRLSFTMHTKSKTNIDSHILLIHLVQTFEINKCIHFNNKNKKSQLIK
jgi:hypothetical protein